MSVKNLFLADIFENKIKYFIIN
ncbi:hypothetical protein PITCH_A1560001 [uncultured Desulfobacterium sp.]|uniref:Uncharacterized protein n=1 Tax=uncultured Desulfobacterium sp. TaxID=201089 RepID=A0A445MTX7_9BACT|nr:hypothetical protein PITCH_A1560001 [uncultured Desulfobacterium sp.]